MTQTPTERYLEHLCRTSFLGMWSHPHPYRDQKDTKMAEQGKELCDLLAVFGDDVFIFSDKRIAYPTGPDPVLNWKRWYKRAIAESVRQIAGAERWLRTRHTSVFADKACRQPLPVALPLPGTMRFHRVLVAHGVADACIRAHGGGSGSLMINTAIDGDGLPFTIGIVDRAVGLVHVLDEVTIDRVLGELDTMPEFRDYLACKEALLAGGKHIVATGEEDLLGFYLSSGGEPGAAGHGFGDTTGSNILLVTEGLWERFERSPERTARDAANLDSYAWDELIERFAQHAMKGTQYFASPGGPQRAERSLRLLAAEPRTVRRALVKANHRLLESLGSRPYRVQIVRSRSLEGTCYAFLVLRRQADESYEDYRQLRLRLLTACTAIARLQEPGFPAYIGIAMGPLDEKGSSEDVVLIDDAAWTPDLEALARQVQSETGLLANLVRREETEREYPLPLEPRPQVRGAQRNAPCPCGSGIKWKKCCRRR